MHDLKKDRDISSQSQRQWSSAQPHCSPQFKFVPIALDGKTDSCAESTDDEKAWFARRRGRFQLTAPSSALRSKHQSHSRFGSHVETANPSVAQKQEQYGVGQESKKNKRLTNSVLRNLGFWIVPFIHLLLASKFYFGLFYLRPLIPWQHFTPPIFESDGDSSMGWRVAFGFTPDAFIFVSLWILVWTLRICANLWLFLTCAICYCSFVRASLSHPGPNPPMWRTLTLAEDGNGTADDFEEKNISDGCFDRRVKEFPYFRMRRNNNNHNLEKFADSSKTKSETVPMLQRSEDESSLRSHIGTRAPLSLRRSESGSSNSDSDSGRVVGGGLHNVCSQPTMALSPLSFGRRSARLPEYARVAHLGGANAMVTPTRSRKYFCQKCERYRPPRSGHCSRCGLCVCRLDHHCAFINNCVGINNHRYFLQFVCTVPVLGAVYLLLAFHAAVSQSAFDQLTAALSSKLLLFICMRLLPCFALFIVPLVSTLCFSQMRAVLKGHTFVESKYYRMRNENEEEEENSDGRKSKSGGLSVFRSEYDRKNPLSNAGIVLGDSLWLWLFPIGWKHSEMQRQLSLCCVPNAQSQASDCWTQCLFAADGCCANGQPLAHYCASLQKLYNGLYLTRAKMLQMELETVRLFKAAMRKHRRGVCYVPQTEHRSVDRIPNSDLSFVQ